KLHVLCPGGAGPLATLHLDGFGVARIRRAGEQECDARRRAWARQLFAAGLLDRFPGLRLVLWDPSFRRTPEAIYDGRIQDPAFWRELWAGPGFTGTWWDER
ncbi:MAG: hypothetical protein FJ098_07940, partial [Deltaproteobacteria bacterium]|nr:hypothetical protein [Deltaproteobacteria bacterium]